MNYPREFDDILYNSDGLLSKSILNQSRRFRQPKRKSDSMFDDQLFKQAFNAPFFQRTTSSFVRDAIPKEFMNTGFDRLFPLTSGHDNTFVNSFRQEHRPIRETQSFRIPSINDNDEEQFFRNRNSSTSSNGVVRNIPIRFMDDQNVRSFNESFNDDYLSFENNVSQQRSDLLNNDFMENNSQSRPFFNNTMYGSAPKSIRRTKSSGQVSPPLFGIWNDFLDHKDIDNNIDRKGPIDIQNVTKPKVPPKPVSLSKSMFSSNDFNQNNRKNSLHRDNYIPNNISNTEKLKDNTEMKFIPRIHQKLKKEDSIDEAIRSLEMLEINPQKYVSYTNSNDIEKNDNKNSQHLDDSSLDSPSSSGIVGDLSDEEKKRSSVNLKYQILSKPNEILGHDNHNRDSFYETLPATLHKPVLSKTAGLTEQTKIIVPMENGNTLTIPLVTNNGIYTNMSESTENINSNYPTNYSKNISLKSDIDKLLSNKRVLVDEMESNMSVLKKCSQVMVEISSPLKWRKLNILENNIEKIRENVNKTFLSLNEISLLLQLIVPGNNNKEKREEYEEIIDFIKEKIKLMNSIKNELEMQKYDVTILARANSFGNPNDSLDQYIAMLKHLPLDVIKIVEWIGILPTDGTIKYLDMDYHMNIIRNQEKNKEPYDECNKVKDSIYKNNNNNNILKNPVTLEYQQTNLSERNKIYNEKNNNNNNTKTIIEEDDLESVVSETNSLHHDYDFIHDKNSYDSAIAKKRFSFLNDENNKEVISSINSISINDKQTILMYAPQFDIHSKQLSSAIETFLTVIENNLPPMEFVQQGKIIILEAHKLVYIGDSISKNLIDIVLKDEMRNMADKLCEVLKICVQNMKIAADEYPAVQPISDMVDQVVMVSNSSCDMKLLINCCIQ